MRLERDGDVFVLHMTDGENRMNDAFVAEWHERLDEVSASSGPAALVTTGAGKFYSNGLDLDWLVGHGDDADLFFRDLFAGWARLLTLPMVTVGAVNGHAFGAGAVLSLVHDRRVMRDDRGWWCMPEAEHGWTLMAGLMAVLTARLPAQTSHDVIVLATRYTGPQALASGIVEQTATGDDVLARAVELAAGHAAKRHDALTRLKHDRHADLVDVLTTDRGLVGLR